MLDGAILTRNPEMGYKPENSKIKHWLFPLKDYSEDQAAKEECNLADAVAHVAGRNGLSINEIHIIFPLILRLLKSNSVWTK